MDLHPTTVIDDHLYCVPTTMLPDQCVLASASADEEDTVVSEMLGDELGLQEPCLFFLCSTTPDEGYSLDSDENGPYVELCFTPEMSKAVLDHTQLAQLETDMVATMRVYASSAAKRAVVVKEDDLLTKADIAAHPKE
eukprot:4261271-Pyramimonas_sp.AAC.1